MAMGVNYSDSPPSTKEEAEEDSLPSASLPLSAVPRGILLPVSLPGSYDASPQCSSLLIATKNEIFLVHLEGLL